MPELTILLREDEGLYQLDEGKRVPGRFKDNIRIDRATHLHGQGQDHAHVYGRKGDEIGVVNMDGSASHSTRCKSHQKDADALRARGFDIPSSNIVEWISLDDLGGELLLG